MEPITQDVAEQVRVLMAAYLGCEPGDIFMAGHEHEELTPGAWSFAYEYDTERLQEFKDATAQRLVQLPPGLYLDAVTHWCLALYRR